jgi:hypothetical protein
MSSGKITVQRLAHPFWRPRTAANKTTRSAAIQSCKSGCRIRGDGLPIGAGGSTAPFLVVVMVSVVLVEFPFGVTVGGLKDTVVAEGALEAVNEIAFAKQLAPGATLIVKIAGFPAVTVTGPDGPVDVAIVSAQISVAGKKPVASAASAKAQRSLESSLVQARRSGYLEYDLKLRLALAEIAMKSGNARQTRPRLEALASEAKTKGFGLIARQAAGALENQSAQP